MGRHTHSRATESARHACPCPASGERPCRAEYHSHAQPPLAEPRPALVAAGVGVGCAPRPADPAAEADPLGAAGPLESRRSYGGSADGPAAALLPRENAAPPRPGTPPAPPRVWTTRGRPRRDEV